MSEALPALAHKNNMNASVSAANAKNHECLGQCRKYETADCMGKARKKTAKGAALFVAMIESVQELLY
jgi:hypothetical protein